MTTSKRLSLKQLIGGGYNRFWKFRGRYRVVKGSRASKKSATASLWYIVNLIKYPGANLLVVRKTFRTLKDSCFAQLKWAIHQLGVDAYFLCKESSLEITYLPTGQKIYFRGLDDPLKVTSIAVDKGCLCWLWLEEGYEITSEADFDMLDESIRGEVPEGLFKQITITFNPWSERHWLKKKFFDCSDPDILAMTTNYMCNEWLDEADRRNFERMRINNPRRYKVAGEGNWGVADGIIYENWEEKPFSVREVSAVPGVESIFGLDFGYTNDPTAFFCGLVSHTEKTIWVFDELYKKALTNRMIFDEITRMCYAKEKIIADSAEPKSIAELREFGLRRIKAANKGKDSVNNGIQKIQDYHIIVHPRCVNYLTEISCYSWEKDKADKPTNKPEDANNHLMDAMRYAMEEHNFKLTPGRVNY